MFKHRFYILLFCVSCTNESSNFPDQGQDDTDTTSMQDVSDEGVQTNSELEELKAFQIEDMPDKWIALTDISNGEGEFAIEKYCDAGTPELRFYQNEKYWNFSCSWGQDDDSWQIEHFEGQVTDNFGSELIKGYFVLKNQLAFPSDTINFSWQTGNKMCQFTDLSMSSEYFVSEKNSSFYSIKEEDCDDFFAVP